jgi:hypothetical protein
METEISTLFSIMRELMRYGLVRSSTDFSRDWLGREGSYVRCLSTKGRKPSAEVWAICAVRLLKRADSPEAISGLGPCSLELRKLADLCLEAVLATGMRSTQRPKRSFIPHPHMAKERATS